MSNNVPAGVMKEARIEDISSVIAAFEPIARKNGFVIALTGGVLKRGRGTDFDLAFLQFRNLPGRADYTRRAIHELRKVLDVCGELSEDGIYTVIGVWNGYFVHVTLPISEDKVGAARHSPDEARNEVMCQALAALTTRFGIGQVRIAPQESRQTSETATS
jgi:hypothetical protein